MLPGISGSLVGSAFLERVLLQELDTSGHAPAPARTRALHRWWRRLDRTLGPASGMRALLDLGALPLAGLLGFDLLHGEPRGEGFVGLLGRNERARAVLRATTWDGDLEDAWRDTVRATHTAHTRWGLVFNGRRLRLVDGKRTWSRRALEFDLELATADARSALILCALGSCDAMDDSHGRGWLSRIVDESDRYGDTVCSALGDGVLEALTALVTALGRERSRRNPHVAGAEVLQQSLTIVYRLLFLLFAEARHLLPTWHPVYREAYTVDHLCRRSLERRRAPGVWAALQAISRLAHAGCEASGLSVTAFNGRLFSPEQTPLAERPRVSEAHVRQAIVAVATTPTAHGRQPIAYADLGVEQLGAVYERVLEYEPLRAGGVLRLSRTSLERKATGSFYTPRPMTEFLVRRTLQPLVAGRSSEEILNLRVVDPAMGSGAFLVAACRYLAAAVERAQIAEGAWHRDDDTRARRSALRRLVAQRCLYGVDRNPMAVQLARLSLWLTTLTSDWPLTFLDHHLATGDSLVGARLADLGRCPRRSAAARRARPLPLFAPDTAGPLATAILPERLQLARAPDDSAAVVRDKERALAALTSPDAPLGRWRLAADLWCAGWFWPDEGLSSGVYGDLVAALFARHASLTGRDRAGLLDTAAGLARAHRFFHWELAFPEVFFDSQGHAAGTGGFDAVVGNPPWDALRADSGAADERDRTRAAQRQHLRFFRDAGAYQHQGHGHANRYQLFLERALQLARRGGRIGLVLPAGFATDRGSAPLRRVVLDTVAVDRLFGFENRHAIFPIHRDARFLLLTGTTGSGSQRIAGAFGRTRAEWLDQLPDDCRDDPPEARSIVLTRSLIESCDRETLTLPWARSAADLDVLVTAHAAAPALAAARGWGAVFGRELNATEDRPHFVAIGPGTSARLLPVIEGKSLEPFRVLRASSRHAIRRRDAARLLDPARTFRRRRLACREVASASNRLTLIAARLPAGTVSTHTILCLKTRMREADQRCLLALLNSLVANYLVRLHVTTHVSAAALARLPVPRPPADAPAFRELGRLASRLERAGADASADAYVRVNTLAARSYGLTADQYAHVVESFPLLPGAMRRALVEDYQRATGRPSAHGFSTA